MLNKKYIIGGIIILIIIFGAIFFSRNNSPTPDASVLEKGVKNLTRESAAEIIETALKANPVGGWFNDKTKNFGYDSQRGHQSLGYVNDSSPELQMIGKLKDDGFAENIEAQKNQYGGNYYDYFVFDFTDKAEPYFVKSEGISPDDKSVVILLAKLEKVEVTGLTEQAVEGGMNTRTADFTATYKATPIGKIIDEKTATAPFKWKAKFVLYDDGWRIAQ